MELNRIRIRVVQKIKIRARVSEVKISGERMDIITRKIAGKVKSLKSSKKFSEKELEFEGKNSNIPE